MLSPNAMADRLRSAFTPGQASVLTDVVWQAYNELVKASDLAELKDVVQELAEAQRRTDEKMGDLAEAQRRTDGRMDYLAHSMQELAQAMKETRREFGGVTASVSYALENEAYRLAPRVLAERYGVTLEEKLVRTTIRAAGTAARSGSWARRSFASRWGGGKWTPGTSSPSSRPKWPPCGPSWATWT